MKNAKRWIPLCILLVALLVIAIAVLTKKEQRLPSVVFPDGEEKVDSANLVWNGGEEPRERQSDEVPEGTEPAAPDTQEPTAQPQQTMDPDLWLAGDTRPEEGGQWEGDTEVLFDLPTGQATPSPAATRKATKRPSATPTPSAKATDAPTANPTNTPKATDSEWSPSII